MMCLWCGKALEAKTSRRRYCNDACRSRAWQKRRERELSAVLDEADRALRKVRRVLLWRDREG